MTEDDWLKLPLDLIAVLTGQHVDLTLIHAQLANVCLLPAGPNSAFSSVALCS